MTRKKVIISPTLEKILKSVGENIKLARLRRKITTTMLAERADISRVTLRRVENGESGVAIGGICECIVLFRTGKGFTATR